MFDILCSLIYYIHTMYFLTSNFFFFFQVNKKKLNKNISFHYFLPLSFFSPMTKIVWTIFVLFLDLSCCVFVPSLICRIYLKFSLFFQVMCIQYWPSAKVKSEDYGDLNISIQHEEELANFHIRTIRVIYKKGTVSYGIEYNNFQQCSIEKADICLRLLIAAKRRRRTKGGNKYFGNYQKEK